MPTHALTIAAVLAVLTSAIAAPCLAQQAASDSVATAAQVGVPSAAPPTSAPPLAVAPSALDSWAARGDSAATDTTGGAPPRGPSRAGNAFRGAVIGAGVGALGGFVLGVTVQCSLESFYGGGCVDSMAPGLTGAAVFGGLGMVTGAVIGALRPIRAERRTAMPATRLLVAPGRGGRLRVGATVPLARIVPSAR